MVEPVGNAPTRIVRLKAGCPSIVALTPLKLVLCSPRRLCVLPNVPVGSHLWGQLPIIKLVDVVGFEPTTFRVRAEYSDPVELHIHKLVQVVGTAPTRIF